MKRSQITSLILIFTTITCTQVNAQSNSNYQIATWYQFKKAAVTYTFDDNDGNQLPIAIPLFDQYNYKITLYTVTAWKPNWQGLRQASSSGHEIASHTHSHLSLDKLNTSDQNIQIKDSQKIIKDNIPTSRCETIAYPYGVMGNRNIIQSCYIAGRICEDSVMPSTPGDFYRITSIKTGTMGTVQTADQFNRRVELARSREGWCIFYIHGIDADGGYSPTKSSELSAHLAYVNANRTDYWVTPFARAVKYIRERNALRLNEVSVTADSLVLKATDQLNNIIYNEPITLRRILPQNWKNARVFSGKKIISSFIETINNKKYIQFDATPDQEIISISKYSAIATKIQNIKNQPTISVFPNPFSHQFNINTGDKFKYSIYSTKGTLLSTGDGNKSLSLGNNLPIGSYIVIIIQPGNNFSTYRVIKK